MFKGIQQNASASEEMAATAAALPEQAQALQRTRRFFQLGDTPGNVGNDTAALPQASDTEPARQLQAGGRAGLLAAADTGDGAVVGRIATGDFKKY